MSEHQITPFVADGQPTMSSREIAEMVGVRHDNVRRTIETLAERGVITLPQIEVKPTSGRPSQEYVFSGELGKRDSIIAIAQLSPEHTARLVDRWQELEASLQSGLLDRANQLSSDEAALKLAHALIAKDADLRIANDKVGELASKINTDAPKVAFAEHIAARPGSVSVAVAAQTMGTGQNRLFAFMRLIGWLDKTNRPIQRKIDDGCLENKVGSWKHPREGDLRQTITALVTAKGLVKLQQLYLRYQAAELAKAAA